MYQAQRTPSSAGIGSGSHLDCRLPVGALQPTDQRLPVLPQSCPQMIKGRVRTRHEDPREHEEVAGRCE